MIKLSVVQNGVLDRLQAMTARASASRGFLNRNVMRWYQNVQRKRWMTENSSEGRRWHALNPNYRARKLRQFESYPGGGRKMLVATNRLFQNVIGPGPEFRKVVTERTLVIATMVPYAKYVDQDRPFSIYGKESVDRISKAYASYILNGGSDEAAR